MINWFKIVSYTYLRRGGRLLESGLADEVCYRFGENRITRVNCMSIALDGVRLCQIFGARGALGAIVTAVVDFGCLSVCDGSGGSVG